MSENLILLLQIIRADGSLEPLVSKGLEYSQISRLVSQLKQEGLAMVSGDKLVLSEEGYQFLNNSVKQKVIGGGWIRALEEYRVNPTEKEEIYLPKIVPLK